MSAPRHLLSKSTYLRSLQCLKSLYLYKFHYALRDPVPPELLARFEKGHDIGRMAHRLFPGGVDCSPAAPWNYTRSLARTAQLVEREYPVIYEAAFQHDRVLAVADILLLRGGKWIVYEVKSSVAVSGTYLNDAALQYEVIAHSEAMQGREIAGFFILHLNRNVDAVGDARPEDVFVETPVLDYCREHADEVKHNIHIAKRIIVNKSMPVVATGGHCEKPYRCDFYGYCHHAERQDKNND